MTCHAIHEREKRGQQNATDRERERGRARAGERESERTRAVGEPQTASFEAVAFVARCLEAERETNKSLFLRPYFGAKEKVREAIFFRVV